MSYTIRPAYLYKENFREVWVVVAKNGQQIARCETRRSAKKVCDALNKGGRP